MTMKKIVDYEIILHGLDWPDYFQGCGTGYTDFEAVATGIGNNDREALEDAMEQLASGDWDGGSNPALDDEIAKADTTDQVAENEEAYRDANDGDGYSDETPFVYASIRVK
jgi:hypothetical protein